MPVQSSKRRPGKGGGDLAFLAAIGCLRQVLRRRRHRLRVEAHNLVSVLGRRRTLSPAPSAWAKPSLPLIQISASGFRFCESMIVSVETTEAAAAVWGTTANGASGPWRVSALGAFRRSGRTLSLLSRADNEQQARRGVQRQRAGAGAGRDARHHLEVRRSTTRTRSARPSETYANSPVSSSAIW